MDTGLNVDQEAVQALAMPTNIEAAFAEWCLHTGRAEAAGISDEQAEGHMKLARQIEYHALTLPTVTARDVWLLIRMTNEVPEGEELPFSGAQVIVRAYREIG